jgi:hypothetical protein
LLWTPFNGLAFFSKNKTHKTEVTGGVMRVESSGQFKTPTCNQGYYSSVLVIILTNRHVDLDADAAFVGLVFLAPTLLLHVHS